MSEQERALARKKHVRGGHRASVTRMLAQVNEMLESPELDVSKLKQFRSGLVEKQRILRALDAELLEAAITEEDIGEEIQQSDLYSERIELAIIRTDGVLQTQPGISDVRLGERQLGTTSVPVEISREDVPWNSRDVSGGGVIAAPTRGVSTPSEISYSPASISERYVPDAINPVISRSRVHVKLPKLSMKKFNGNLTTWTTFWDSFEATVHANPDLSNIDKFNYLNSLLEGSAAEAISGLSLTASNYEEAVAVLKKRFGNTQLIINKHMDALLSLDPVTSTNTKVLRCLCDQIDSHIRSLKSLDVPSSSYGRLLSSVLMSKIPQELRLIVSRKVSCENFDFDEIMKVIEDEIDARERVFVNLAGQVKKQTKELQTAAALVTHEETTETICVYCNRAHLSGSCRTVTKADERKNILMKTGRCFVCLKKYHRSRDCRSSVRCSNCNGRHHSSICGKITDTVKSTLTSVDVSQSKSPSTPGSSSYGSPSPHSGSTRPKNLSAISMYVDSRTPVLLQTATTIVRPPNLSSPTVRTRIILDTGSQRSYVTQRLKEKLSLHLERVETLLIKTFGSTEEQPQYRDVVKLVLTTRDGPDLELEFVVVPLICETLSGQQISRAVELYPHLFGLEMADIFEDDNMDVNILIGLDHYWRVVSGSTVSGKSGPTAIGTKFGWVLSGPMTGMTVDTTVTNFISSLVLKLDTLPLQCSDDTLERTLRRFWDLESLGILSEEPTLYDKFADSIRFIDNRYQVHLPWKEIHPVLPQNYELSENRLRGLLRRLQSDKEMLRDYDSVIKDQFSKGIIELVQKPWASDFSGKIHYIPHHAVIRRDKKTTKLRIVYDASARSAGPSLNDCLYAGPSFGQNILDIILRFRMYMIALIGDIEKAFLMVSVAPEDRDVLRFLWVDDVAKEFPQILVFRFTRVVFGVSSSPFLLNATLKYHMESFKDIDLPYVEKFLKSIYVDDVTLGADDEEELYDLYEKSKRRLAEGGFNLRKLICSSPTSQARIDRHECDLTQRVDLQNSEDDQSYTKATLVGDVQCDEIQKVLGVLWNPVGDCLVFDTSNIYKLALGVQPTKRSVVSLISRFFDPIGVISPITVKFKIFAQELCEANLAWDAILSNELVVKWNNLVSSLQCPGALSIPRCYFSGIEKSAAHCSLRGFCDASMGAYAAVVYLMIKSSASIVVRFVVAKSRVAPVHNKTIPRLELLAALLLARLMNSVTGALQPELKLADPRCYTDSQVALCWIKHEDREWKQFVQNRVTAIRRLVPSEHWNHCSGISNPADIPSRGASMTELSSSSLWLDGPQWLTSGDADHECREVRIPEDCMKEMKGTTEDVSTEVLTVLTNEPQDDLILQCEEFSILRRLLIVSSYVIQFVDKLITRRSNIAHNRGTEYYLTRAEIYWITVIQRSLLQSKSFGMWKHQFGVFVDNEGIWRCCGRLGNADIPDSSKYPILLDAKHHVTALIVKACHEKVLHGGVKSTLTELRSRYWAVKGRSLVKKILHRCVICRKTIFTSTTSPIT